MAGTEDPKIECDQCGKVYRWKPELAGKRVKCACGNKVDVPKQEDPADESGTYELNFDDDEPTAAAPTPPAAPPKKPESAEAKPPKSKPKDKPQNKSKKPDKPTIEANEPPPPPDKQKGRCPSCGNTTKLGAVICLNCGYNLQTGQKVETAIKEAGDGPAGKPADVPKLTGMAAVLSRQKADQDALRAESDKQHQFQEVYLPLILFGVGFALLMLNTWLLAYTDSFQQAWNIDSGFMARVFMTVIDLVTIVIQLPVVLIALILTAMLFGSSYGPLITATLKMLALVVFSSAISAVTVGLILLMTGGLSVLGMEYMIALLFSATAFFGIAMTLFDMDFMEAAVLYVLTVFGPWIVLIGGAFLVGVMFF